MKEDEDSADDELDAVVDFIQAQIDREEEEEFSEPVVREYRNPNNVGRMGDADGQATIKGSCGDTMEFYIRVENEKIRDIRFMTDGCGSSIACGSRLTRMAKGKGLEEVEEINQMNLMDELDGLPPDYIHCAKLAVDTLRAAINNYKEEKEESE